MEKIKVIIDTDIGSDIDDALCLAYCLNHPNCEILGITTCSSEPEKRAEIVYDICNSAGVEVPICSGLKDPLKIAQRQVAVHQYSVVENMQPKRVFSDNAIEFIKYQVEKYPKQAVILAIGPLTNIGALLIKYPSLASNIKCIAIMGGSFFEEGKNQIECEFNIKCDPDGAKAVFESGAQIFVSGIDVSLKTKTDAREFLKMEHCGVMASLTKYVEKFTERTFDMYYHDVIPATALFNDKIIKFKRGEVKVHLDGKVGLTDFIENENGNVYTAFDIDCNEFFSEYQAIVKDRVI